MLLDWTGSTQQQGIGISRPRSSTVLGTETALAEPSAFATGEAFVPAHQGTIVVTEAGALESMAL